MKIKIVSNNNRNFTIISIKIQEERTIGKISKVKVNKIKARGIGILNLFNLAKMKDKKVINKKAKMKEFVIWIFK